MHTADRYFGTADTVKKLGPHITMRPSHGYQFHRCSPSLVEDLALGRSRDTG
jgi:hypothetical protein